MKRVLLAWVFSMFVSAAAAGVGASTGYDTRIPIDGSMQVNGRPLRWTDYPYNLIVKVMLSEGGACTGQYVARDLILTAAHCAPDKNQTAQTADGRSFPIELYARGPWKFTSLSTSTLGAQDWAIYRIVDSIGFLPADVEPLDVAPKSQARGDIWNAGWGSLRIFDDADIIKMKEAIVSTLKDQLKKLISNPTYIQGIDQKVYSAVIKAFPDAWGDSDRLKLTPSCTTKNLINSRYIYHDCNCVPGNSGSALIFDKGGGHYSVAGVMSGATPTVGKVAWGKVDGWAARTELFYDVYQKAKASSPPSSAPSQQSQAQSQSPQSILISQPQPSQQPSAQPSMPPQIKAQYCIDCAAAKWAGTASCPSGGGYKNVYNNNGRLYRLMTGAEDAAYAFKYARAYVVDDSFCKNTGLPLLMKP